MLSCSPTTCGFAVRDCRSCALRLARGLAWCPPTCGVPVGWRAYRGGWLLCHLVEVRVARLTVPLEDERHRECHYTDCLQDEEDVVVVIERAGQRVERRHENDRQPDQRAEAHVPVRAPLLVQLLLWRHVTGEDEQRDRAEKDEQRCGAGQMHVGQPELAQRGILRSGMEERDA